jgi:hypothetical protein
MSAFAPPQTGHFRRWLAERASRVAAASVVNSNFRRHTLWIASQYEERVLIFVIPDSPDLPHASELA